MVPNSFSPAAPGAGYALSYGGFRLGELLLALPMGALREIVPCPSLVPLRGMADCIAGGLARGASVIPVVDMRTALGQPLDGPAATRVVLMVHQGSLLGLLAHDATGMFTGPAITADPAAPASRHASPLISGHVPLSDGRNLRILSLDALAALPQARTVPPSVSPKKAAPMWLGALSFRWGRLAAAPGRNSPSTQLSRMRDAVACSVRG